MDTKNVLFAAPRFHTNQFFLSKQLIEKGYNVEFLVVFKGKSENYSYLEPKVLPASRFCSLKTKNGRSDKNESERLDFRKKYFSSFRKMFKEFKVYKPDYVIIRNLKSLYSWQVLFFSLLFLRKSYLYTQNPLHQNISAKRRLFYKILGVFNIHHFTPVLGIKSDPVLPNTSYIPFVIDPLVDESVSGTREDFKIVTIGKMMDRKNIKELILQLKNSIHFNTPLNTLVVIAECSTDSNRRYYSDLQTIINEAKDIQFNIDFNINIKHEEVIRIMKDGDVFILPSNDEPAAFSILEGMACGLPVICSDKNGTSCYIDHNVNGFVFKYTSDLQHLLPFVDNLMSSNEFIKKAGTESLRMVRDNHQVKNFIDVIMYNKAN